MDLLNELEASFPVDEWMIDGIHVWPIVRERLWWHLDDLSLPQRQEVRAGRPLSRRVAQARGALAGVARCSWTRLVDSEHEASLRKQASVVVLGDNVSRTWIDHAWYDRLCEPFIAVLDRLGLNAVHLEPHHLYRRPRHDASRFVQPAIDRCWFRSRLRRPSFGQRDLARYDVMLKSMAARGLPVDAVSEHNVVRHTWFIRLLADHFAGVFQRVGASVGALVDYNATTMAFNLACRERGVPSIELQHGVQGDLHWAYARWNKVPVTGYELLPSVYWTWSEAEAATIRRWSDPVSRWHRPVVGGNLWLEQWRGAAGPLVERYDTLARGLCSKEPGARHILLTLQTGLTSEPQLARWLEAIERSPASWRWWTRLHPTMAGSERARVHERFTRAHHPRIELERPSELPLYALLRHADVHVTVSSSTVLEAAELGVPSVATMDDPTAAFPEEAGAGWVVQASLPEEIVAAIERQLDRRPALRSRSTTPGPSAVAVLREVLASSS